MSDLVVQLQRLAYEHPDRYQSAATQKDRVSMLALCGQQLLELGFTDLTVHTLAHEHAEALVGLWRSQGLSVNTVCNRVAVLRWWARMVQRGEYLAFRNVAYGLRRERLPALQRAAARQPSSATPQKRCSICRKTKVLEAFTRSATAADGRSYRCLACGRLKSARYAATHRAEKRAYDALHTAARRRRDATRRRVDPGKASQRCVYVVQLLARSNTVKIGYTTGLRERLRALQHQYGDIRCLMALPQQELSVAEKLVHEVFAPMRIYEGASSSELFSFNTRAKQKRLEAFCAQFLTYCLAPVTWTSHPSRRPSQSSSLQQALFS